MLIQPGVELRIIACKILFAHPGAVVKHPAQVVVGRVEVEADADEHARAQAVEGVDGGVRECSFADL